MNFRTLRARLALAAGVVVMSFAAMTACVDESTGSEPATLDSDGGSAADARADGSLDATTYPVRRPEGPGRDAPEACTSDAVNLAPDDAGGGDAGDCLVDSDCTAGDAGQCHARLHTPGNGCAYHQCNVDSDCAGDKGVCGCGAARSGRNLCMPLSNCRTNADCPTSERCLHSVPHFQVEDGTQRGDIYNGVHGYFCTTPRDDCNTPASFGAGCVWDPGLNRWAFGSGP